MGIILRYKDFLNTYKTRGHRIKHLEEYKKLFPIKSSPSLAGIVADLICDGHLQGDPKWRIDFTSKDTEELKRFENEITKIFGVSGKIRECLTNAYAKSYNMGINCSPLARILLLMGVPPGQKVLQNFDIPEWIVNDKECFRVFCKRVFTCEGSIMNEKRRKIPQIRLEMWKEESLIKNGEGFLDSLCKTMKKYFNIDSTIRTTNNTLKRNDGKTTRAVRIYVLNESVIKFFKEVGFEGAKQKSLKALITGYL